VRRGKRERATTTKQNKKSVTGEEERKEKGSGAEIRGEE